MTVPTKGSLCSGYGGLDRALPGTLRWTSEIDDAASLVLKREHPDAPNHGDMRGYPWSADDHADLLTAGVPCQPVSAAGRQQAHDDHRWLWPDLWNVVRAVRPGEIFLENVQNIRSILAGAVLREILAEVRALGYAARWTVLGACAVGAPHHRHRWFLRGTLVGATTSAPEATEVKVKCGAPRGGGRVLLPTPVARDGDPNRRGEGSAEYWAKRAEYRTAGMPLGAAVGLLPVPLLPTPRATDVGTAGRHSSEGWRPQLGQAVLEQWGKFAEAVALWEGVIGRPAPVPTVPGPKGGRRLNPVLSEWMMGLPAGMVTDGIGSNDALRLAGNGVVPLQARTAYDLLG